MLLIDYTVALNSMGEMYVKQVNTDWGYMRHVDFGNVNPVE